MATRQGGRKCNPLDAGDVPPPITSGTRDTYHVYDFDQLITGDQANERALNCVAGATD